MDQLEYTFQEIEENIIFCKSTENKTQIGPYTPKLFAKEILAKENNCRCLYIEDPTIQP